MEENIENFFRLNHGELFRFGDVKEKRSNRPDLHAFMLLDSLFPGYDSIIAMAFPNEIWLSIGTDDLWEKATADQLLDLIRCGVMYDSENDQLHMRV